MIFYGYKEKKIDYYGLLQKRKKPITGEEAVTAWFAMHTGSRRRKLAKLCLKQRWHCFYCNKKTAHRIPGKNGGKSVPTLEHLTQQSIGGTDSLDNLVMACGDCNSRRHDIPAYQYLALVQSGWRDYVENHNKAETVQRKKPVKDERVAQFVMWMAYYMCILSKSHQK